jgi:hypothetical protein
MVEREDFDLSTALRSDAETLGDLACKERVNSRSSVTDPPAGLGEPPIEGSVLVISDVLDNMMTA